MKIQKFPLVPVLVEKEETLAASCGLLSTFVSK